MLARTRNRGNTATTLLGVVVVVGYFAFEVSNLHRLKYRTEPAFILNEFASAYYAVEACPVADAKQTSDFTRNYAHVRRNALKDAQAQETSAEETVSRIIDGAKATVNELLLVDGCNGTELKRLQKLHQVRARLNLR